MIATPRTGTGPERVATFLDSALKALTSPLTPKELESGLYNPPPSPRIIFTGTLDDAQNFFQATTPIANCHNCPIAKMTDGLPIIVPTEDKVKEMLTGTSHSPTEQIYRYTMNATTRQIQKANLVSFAQAYSATVEKVAVIAVMAGCRPEYLPAVLAVASASGGSTNCPGTSSTDSSVFVVSGPFTKEVGMNSAQGALDDGNPPNLTIGRSAKLMTVNFGQCIQGISRTDSGNPNDCLCFAEDVDMLPAGWEGLNQISGYKSTDSVLGKTPAAGIGSNAMEVGRYAPHRSEVSYHLEREEWQEGLESKVFLALIIS